MMTRHNTTLAQLFLYDVLTMRRVNSQRPSRPRDWTGNLFFFIPFLLVLLSQKVIDDAVGRTYLDNDSYTLPLDDEKDSELLTLRPINDVIIPKSAENSLSTDKIINMDDVIERCVRIVGSDCFPLFQCGSALSYPGRMGSCTDYSW